MAKKKIVWASNAKTQLLEILEYFIIRNKSNSYSIKLHKIFKSQIALLVTKPEIGKKSSIDNVRGLIIEDYIVFYEINDKHIVILSIWDCRQNPNKLNL